MIQIPDKIKLKFDKKTILSYFMFKRKLATLRAKYKYQMNKAKSNGYIYYKGTISSLHPEVLEKGNTIITPHGIGIVNAVFPKNGPNKRVEVWLYSKKKHFKAFRMNEVYQYFVYNILFDIHIPILPSCYTYIFGENDTIEYRITDKGYADLSDESKKNKEYISMFNEKKGGRLLLRDLTKKGYKIIKDGNNR